MLKIDSYHRVRLGWVALPLASLTTRPPGKIQQKNGGEITSVRFQGRVLMTTVFPAFFSPMRFLMEFSKSC